MPSAMALIGLATGVAFGKPGELLLARGPDTLHPLYAWTPEDHLVANLVHERLFEPDGKGGWRSDVVSGVTVDGASVTLTLAKLTWQDKQPFVAADVCATIERIRAADRPTPFTPAVTARVASCVADDRDARVARITLTAPAREPRAWLALPLVPAHLPEWAGAGPQNSLPAVGLGPYGIERDGADRWHLSGGKRAPVSKLDVAVAADPETALAGGRGVGAPFVSPPALPLLRSHPEITLEVEAPSAVWALMVNPSRGPLGDPRVRQGLDLLIDRDALAAALYGEDPELASQPWTPAAGPFVRDVPSGVPVTLRDPNAAAVVLTEAGLVKTDQGWTWHDQPLSLRVAAPLGLGPDPGKLEAALSQQLEGIRVEVAPLSSTQWWFSLLAGAHGAVTDLALVPIDPQDLAATLHSRTATDGLENPFQWSDPRVDAWLDRGDGAPDELAGILSDARPALFLWALKGRSAWRSPYESLRPVVLAP